MTNSDNVDDKYSPIKKFICEICDFKSNNKKDFNRHLGTLKHNNKKNNVKNPKIICKCGKEYSYRQGLSLHKKKCNYKEEENIKCEIISNNEMTIIKELKDIILKQQEQISELIPKVGNNNTTNHNNQKVNINVFLNEYCKDAMSINDFVESIEISLKNLLTTKSKGLTMGLNDIINENMNKLSIYERPIHCTDKKRETLYVKNNNWEKDIDKSSTTSMLKGLQLQQIKNLHKFKEEHPDYEKDEDLKHEYMILVNKCTKPLSEGEKKLFKNLCDNTYLKDEELVIKE
jgi:hypothetical protein